MDSQAFGEKDHIIALSAFLIDEHCLKNSKETVVIGTYQIYKILTSILEFVFPSDL